MGGEKHRLGALAVGAPGQIAGDCETYGPSGLRADGPDIGSEPAMEQSAEDKRGREGILAARGKDALARTEAEIVRRSLGGDRKSPGDVAGSIADQEEEIALQLFSDGFNARQRQPQSLGDTGQRNWTSGQGEGSDHEISNGMMVGGHEGQMPARPVRGLADAGLPLCKGLLVEFAAPRQ